MNIVLKGFLSGLLHNCHITKKKYLDSQWEPSEQQLAYNVSIPHVLVLSS